VFFITKNVSLMWKNCAVRLKEIELFSLYDVYNDFNVEFYYFSNFDLRITVCFLFEKHSSYLNGMFIIF